jgi:16S rRNA (guanine527-N7)-methyltransferase
VFHVKLSGVQEAQLGEFEALLLERARGLGLIAEGDLDRVRERHIDDSLRAASFVGPTDRRAYDLGSGGGLPGVVLAIAVPTCRFVLVESRRKRAGFLELAVERLDLSNAEVFHGRAEDLSLPADLITARAFAPLKATWKVAFPLLRPGGRLVFFAGEREDPAAAPPTEPEPPVRVEWDRRLANRGPLVIMARG